MPDYLIAIDQGTTSTRAIVFDAALAPVASAQQELRQIYPAPGLVEHDPEEIWSATLATVRTAMGRAGAQAKDIAALGITNQRETAVIWDRATNRPIHNAIVWQDRRTADRCAALRQDGHEPTIAARTGLLLDPYFSATKIAWLLDHVEGARNRCDQRVPDDAAGHPPWELGRRALPIVRCPRSAPAAGARLRRRLRHD